MFDASMRLPAARICMSWMVAPASSRAASTASLARSMESLSGYRPNLVIEAPMIQTSCAMSRSS